MLLSNYKSENRSLFQEARAYIRDVTQERARIASDIRTVRTESCKLMNQDDRRRTVRLIYKHLIRDVPAKPTADSLYREAVKLYEFSQTPLPGINGSGSYDTEYYSYCGTADYHVEQREQAFAQAQVLYIAAHLMGYRPASVFESADDSMTRMCSELLRIGDSFSSEYADVEEMYAPSECLNTVILDYRRTAHKLVQEYGYETTDQAESAVINRTSYRWLWCSDIAEVFAMATRHP